MKRRTALVAMAAWLTIVVGVFAYAMLSDESESTSPPGPDPTVSSSTVPRTTLRSDGTAVLVEADPSTEVPAEVLGEVQLPFSGYSLFKVGPKASTPPPFVLPDYVTAYVGPGFVFTQPGDPGPGTTVPARPLDPPTTRPPVTAPPTTAPPTTQPPVTEPPTTAPPTTQPPVTEPPTTAPPTTEPPTTAPPPPPTTTPDTVPLP